MDARYALDARVAYEVLAEALLNVPSERVLSDVRLVAQAMGRAEFDQYQAAPELEQRYYDRFFVPTGGVFVPLSESRFSNVDETADRIAYGPEANNGTDHVTACYRQVGFEYRALAGYDLAVQRLRPDSLASELAFLAYVHTVGCVQDATGELNAWDRFALQFLREHTGWMTTAAQVMARTDDLYARLCVLAVDVCAADRAQLEELAAADL